MDIRFPWRTSEDPWVLPLWVACGADGNIIATRRFQVVWRATVLWLQRGLRVVAPGSDTDLQCRPTGWAESWAQNCGGGEMILAATWLLKP